MAHLNYDDHRGQAMSYMVGNEPNKPVCIFDADTGDVLAYIPDGKTRIERTGDECADCVSRNIKTAERIIAALVSTGGKP